MQGSFGQIEARVLEALGETAVVREVVHRDHHSNLMAEVRFRDGRVLVIKQAPDPTLARFPVSRAAARLVADHTDLVAPDYLELGLPETVLVYWWLPWPTLASMWRDRADRGGLAASWGRAMAALHRVPLDGHGPLDGARGPLRDWLRRDLADRLLPAVAGAWPDGEAAVHALLARVPDLPDAPPTLVHNDLFDRNVLCDPDRDEVVGVIDFEDAFAGPAEADLAKIEVVHGPLFRDPLSGDWLSPLLSGWGRAPDPARVSFFRAWNLLNMGYHGALQGYDAHAAEVARAAAAEIAAFGTGARHAELVAG